MNDPGVVNRPGSRLSWLRLVIFPTVAALLAAVAMFYAVSAYVINEAEKNVQNIMLSQRGVHHYIQRVMHPAFFKARDEGIIAKDFYAPEVLSSSFIVRVMHLFYNEERLKAGMPKVYYKLASDNPRNPVNKADGFESSLIRKFNEHKELKKYRSVITIEGKKYLYYAIPFLETNSACIRCHGERSAAPLALQRRYTGNGGFNEQAGRIRAIESIRMPIGHEMSAVAIVVVSLSAFVFVGLVLLTFNRRLSKEVYDRTAELETEIGERSKVEELLRASEENYRNISDLTSDFVHKCVRTGSGPFRIQWAGGGVGAISGYSAEEIYEKGCWLSFVHPDDRQTVSSHLQGLVPGDRKVVEFRLITKGGETRWISEASNCLAGEGEGEGEVVLFGASRDITERKHFEEALRMTRVSVEAASDAIFWIKPDGRFLDVNPAACRSLGYTREELLQLSVPDIDPHHDSGAWQRNFADLRKRGTLKFESEHRTRNGELIPVEICANHVRYGAEELNCAFVRDITENKRAEQERRKLEQQLLHTQKLESLGVLAGGIAHDFNNILTAIIGNADLALMRLSPESPVLDNLKRIEHAAGRAADLAKQMLAYSGKGKFVVEAIDLNRMVEEMGHMLEVSISKKAILRYNFTRPLPSVEADATQIRQIIMNLVINASEAIGERSGVIAISTGCLQCDEKYLQGTWLFDRIPEGLYVFLEIADTGCGMDESTLGKIFDPFFTTKFTGRGLGMAAVLGIIRGHKGTIKVYSEPNRGTTFKVLFPASGRPKEMFNPGTFEEGWKGEGKVLLVDDEETVRGIGSEMLKELGFTPITADDGREAVEIFRNTPDIAFVILDLTMPHMDGEQCFRELRQMRPGVRVIMSSGFSEHEVTQKFSSKGIAGFVQKPYTLSVLREVIRGLTP